MLSIGIQVDPDQFFDPNTGKYDIDGPKNLYDNKMLCDWYIKIVTEHPLVSYIEDGVRVGDVEGWKQLQTTMKAKYEHVQIGVNKWFKSDFEQIKLFTQMVPPNDEEEEVELEEGEEPPEDPNAHKFVPDLIHLSK